MYVSISMRVGDLLSMTPTGNQLSGRRHQLQSPSTSDFVLYLSASDLRYVINHFLVLFNTLSALDEADAEAEDEPCT